MDYKWLIASNFMASGLVIVHFGCEFFHYIHSFYSSKKEEVKLEDIHKHLEDILERLKKVEENGSKYVKRRSSRTHTMRFTRRKS